MALLLFYGVFAIFISFLCSMLEACLLSLPRSYVEALVERGSRWGLVLREMKHNIDRPLVAILTLNTIAHTVGAAGVGAQAAVVFGSAAVGIASAIMTLLILVLSEIIPKTLGAVHAKRIAVPAALTIRAMIWLCMPLIIPLEWINRLVAYQRHESRMNRAELLATIRLGHASGTMGEHEYTVATNVIALSDISLSDILTPRTVVFSLPQDMTVGEALKRHYPLRFSRIPVYSGNPERITGVVSRFALHEADSARQHDRPLSDFLQPIPIVPEAGTVGNTLEMFIKEKHHIAMVADEFGGLSGIITLEDLLETLLGEEIVDETDTVEDMQELARRRRELRRREGQ